MGKPKDPDYFKKYYKANPDKYKSSYHTKKREVYRLLGDKCACCGFDEFSCLQIDHIDNDGADHRFNKSASAILTDIIAGKVNVQILCGNCHNSKTKLGNCYHKLF